MDAIWTNAFTFFATIAVMFVLSRRRVIPKDSGEVLASVMVKVTLPMAIANNLNGADISPSAMYLVLVGIVYAAAILAGSLLAGRVRTTQALCVVGLAGFNIGNFALPFVAGMFSQGQIAYTSIFDIGNCLVTFGIAAPLVKGLATGGRSHFGLRSFLKAIVSSIPVMTYIFMLALCMAHLELPGLVMHVLKLGAEANPFVSMAVIGASASTAIDEMAKIRDAAWLILVRLAIAAVELAITLALPIGLDLKVVLAVLCMAPIAAVDVAFAAEAGLAADVVALANTLYVPISIVLMSAVAALVGA